LRDWKIVGVLGINRGARRRLLKTIMGSFGAVEKIVLVLGSNPGEWSFSEAITRNWVL
jgi:hypothetical protein